MAKFIAEIAVCAGISVPIEAENMDEAMQKAEDLVRDQDVFFKTYGNSLALWNPEVDYVEEDGADEIYVR